LQNCKTLSRAANSSIYLCSPALNSPALLAVAVLGVVIFRMLHLPPMLGYLAVGILIGPHELGLTGKSHTTDLLAEFGVVFLMFSIGLEFLLLKLVAMRRTVFGLGMAQIVVTMLAVMGIASAVSWLLPQFITINWQAAFALGLRWSCLPRPLFPSS
jgi:CPA2 family monovalent cation:H+ antiporter-2